MIVKEMRGHSGCAVWMLEENGVKFVRKTSSSVSYNSRLEAQMNKQKEFNHDTLKTPTVFNSGIDNELFYFDMDFISGVQFHSFISCNPMSHIEPIFDKLQSFLEEKETKPKDISGDILNKVKSLYDVLPRDLRKYCGYCVAFDWENSESSYSHGDMTFENIIVRGSDLYLIDFLDTFVDAKSVDYSKMLQDILLMWSWRHEERAPFVKNICLYDKLVSNLNEYDVESSNRFLVLNLLRIIPYANEDGIRFIRRGLKHLEERMDI